MPGHLRQSTASQSRALGPFLDDTDFKTPETGLTIANTDIKLVVNGGASANKNSGGGTHRVNGVYGVTFDATDTATVGEMEVSVVVSGALPVFDKWEVVEEAVYDALYAASAPGYLQPTVAARTLDVTATGAAGIDWGNIENETTSRGLSNTQVGSVYNVVNVGTGAIVAASFDASSITAAALATDAANEIADAFLDRDMSTGTDSGSSSVRTPRQALRFLRNKWAIVAGALTVYKENDSTSSWTATVSSDAAAEPVIGNDPA